MRCKILSKLGMIPAIATFCLIWFITYEFIVEYMVKEFADARMKMVLIISVFLYFSILTQLHLARTLFGNPGYLPDSLKREKVDGKVPRELRLFKMKHYQRNRLYDFNRDLVAHPDGTFTTM